MTEGFSLLLFLSRDLCTNSYNGKRWDADIFADIEYPELNRSKSYYEVDFLISAPVNAISSGVEERIIYFLISAPVNAISSGVEERIIYSFF